MPDWLKIFLKWLAKNLEARPLRYLLVVFVFTSLLQIAYANGYLGMPHEIKEEIHQWNLAEMEAGQRYYKIDSLEKLKKRAIYYYNEEIHSLEMQRSKVLFEIDSLELIRDGIIK